MEKRKKEKEPTLEEIAENMDDDRNYRLQKDGYFLANGMFLKGKQWKQLIKSE